MMNRVTLGTNVFPAEDVIEAAHDLDFEFSVVTVTQREVNGTDIEVSLNGISPILETGVWDQSFWGQALWGPAIQETSTLNRSNPEKTFGIWIATLPLVARDDGQRKTIL